MPGFTLFVFLWCAAILFHQLYQGRFVVLDPTCLLSVAALWSLLRPTSLPRFAVLLAACVATVAVEMPRVVNHWLLAGVTSLGLLLALAPSLLRGRRPTPALLAGALRSVQVQILLVYLLATLAKLNSGFFDPAHSCGAEHYRRLTRSVPLLPTAPWAIWAAIVGTVVVEAGLPVLLLIRRTRLLAFAAGWVFHLMLGFNGYWDFSMFAAAYYASFAPDPLLARWRAAVHESPALTRAREGAQRLSRSPAAFPLAALVLLLLPAAIGSFSDLPERQLVLAANHVERWIWVAVWAVLGGVLLLALRGPAAPAAATPDAVAWWRRPALWVAPLLVLLNGFSPYLGLKTENSYTMFSNLRTEGGEWNHYLVPRQLQIFGFQDEPVSILRSNDPYLRRLAAGQYRLVPLELRRYAAEHPDAALVYQSRRGRFTARRAAEDPRLGPPPGTLAAKLLLFRPVPPPERNECLH